MMRLNILGQDYEIIVRKEKEDPKLMKANGYCECYSKKIVLEKVEEDENTYENLDDFRMKVLYHEIIHAFLFESGLRDNSDWARNEEMVDWLAIQFPKISKIFDIAKLCLKDDTDGEKH